MSRRGTFILLEGPDGGGKTTIAARLGEDLSARGYSVVLVREPGGTVSGEMIRDILLSPASGELTAVTETLLFYAARAQLIHDVIRPALENGGVVIADRYELSTWVYQSYAGGLDLDAVRSVGEWATGGLHPDVCFVLDVETETGLSRKKGDGALDRMELKDIEYRRKLREGYLTLASQVPYRCRVIDAGNPPETVYADVLKEVDDVLG